jgi:hypothetical protein
MVSYALYGLLEIASGDSVWISARNLPGGSKGWLARKADNFTAICEPIV